MFILIFFNNTEQKRRNERTREEINNNVKKHPSTGKIKRLYIEEEEQWSIQTGREDFREKKDWSFVGTL